MNHFRQERILPIDAIVFPVTVIGAGGIGSPTTLMLAKIGFENITLIDSDAIEDHNVPNHLLWGPTDAGRPKVDTAHERVLCLTGIAIKKHACSFPNESLPTLSGIVISGVDSMESRKAIWSKVAWNSKIPVYLDARTGVGTKGQWMEIHTVRPSCLEDVEFYEKHLHEAQDIDPDLACDAFLPVNMAIASLIGSQLTHWLMQEPYWQRLVFNLKNLTLIRQEERQKS
ncbi:MAG: ThiF family adenylyltransferase [bacterium]|nr:ThiF family adenylyltransferase [bacterium]